MGKNTPEGFLLKQLKINFFFTKIKKFYVRNGANSISYFATNLERDFILSFFYLL